MPEWPILPHCGMHPRAPWRACFSCVHFWSQVGHALRRWATSLPGSAGGWVTAESAPGVCKLKHDFLFEMDQNKGHTITLQNICTASCGIQYYGTNNCAADAVFWCFYGIHHLHNVQYCRPGWMQSIVVILKQMDHKCHKLNHEATKQTDYGCRWK